MARKKRTRKRATRRGSHRVASKSGNIKKKITLVVNNLLLFIALSLVSFVLYRFLQNDLLVNLFQIMAMIFGFVSVAFLITLLVLVIMKMVKKR